MQISTGVCYSRQGVHNGFNSTEGVCSLTDDTVAENRTETCLEPIAVASNSQFILG